VSTADPETFWISTWSGDPVTTSVITIDEYLMGTTTLAAPGLNLPQQVV